MKTFIVDYYFKQTPPKAIITTGNQYGPAYSVVVVNHWITDTPHNEVFIN